jgi:iron complex outermembrane receptor protein
MALALVAALASVAAAAAGGDAAGAGPVGESESEPHDFGHLDFEELRRIKVVTASRVEESLFGVPAAAHVITPVDIRRSGAKSLPEALRLVPGVEVGRINSRSYSITMRGFNGASANKLLPMIDGRSIYSQRYSGTIWDARDVMLDDVSRIEVIGGPGGAVWGANAVNGVINVITKDARETQGTLVDAGGGSLLRAFATVRHGFELNDHAWMRVFARGYERGETSRLDGRDPNDSWNLGRGGFRLDAEGGAKAHWTVMGDAFTSEAEQILPPSLPSTALTSGGVLQFRGRIGGEGGGVTSINSYYDRLLRNSGGFKSHSDVVELDLQREMRVVARHHLTGGLNYRFSRLEDWDATVSGVQSSWQPHLRQLSQAGVFVQDRFALVPDRFTATVGCKLEYDDFTGTSPLPSVRLAWTPSASQTAWAAVSRATRIPSRAENDQSTQTPGPVVSSPNTDLVPESVVAWEAGYRVRPTERMTVDVTAYYDAYADVFASVTDFSGSPITSKQANALQGEAWGGTGSATWLPATWWQLQGSLSFVEVALRRTNPGVSHSAEVAEALSPAQQGSLRSSWTFGRGVEADLWFRRVGELPGTTTRVPGYSTLDSRVAWQPREKLVLSVAGQNLLEPVHQEFRFFVTRWEVPRSVTGEVTLRF